MQYSKSKLLYITITLHYIDLKRKNFKVGPHTNEHLFYDFGCLITSYFVFGSNYNKVMIY